MTLEDHEHVKNGCGYIDELLEHESSRRMEVVYSRAVVALMLQTLGYSDRFIALQLGVDRTTVIHYRNHYVRPPQYTPLPHAAARLYERWQEHDEWVSQV